MKIDVVQSVSQGAHGRLKREIGKSSEKRVNPLRQKLALHHTICIIIATNKLTLNFVETCIHYTDRLNFFISKQLTVASEEYFTIRILFKYYQLYVGSYAKNEVAEKKFNSSVQANSIKNDVARSRYNLYMSNRNVKKPLKDNQVLYSYFIFLSYNI